MSAEVFVLGLASAARPTGIAVVYALLSTPQPRRLLFAYIVAGAAWSVAIGVIVVGLLKGVHVHDESSNLEGAVDLLGGVAALGFAAGMATNRLMPPTRSEPRTVDSRVTRALRNPSLAVAAGAGVATHLPGLFYLVALNAIVASTSGFAEGAAVVLVFNAIWFVTPIVSLVLSVRRPEQTRQLIGRFNAWAKRYQRALLAGLFAAVGLYLVARGLTIIA
jgi:hypothetical protein